MLPVLAKAIYGSFCNTESEIFNVVNYNNPRIISDIKFPFFTYSATGHISGRKIVEYYKRKNFIKCI